MTSQDVAASDLPVPEAMALVAPRALVEKRRARLPSPVGVRPPTGVVSRRALGTVRAIAEALFSVDGKGPPPVERIDWVCDEYADFLGRATPFYRFLFAVAATVVSVVAPLMIGRLPPLRRLPLERRVLALTRFEEKPTAPVLIAIRALICLHYYEHPDAAREIGVELTRAPRLAPEGRP